MARPRRAHVRTEAKITREAIAELQAQMQAINATMQALAIQKPLQSQPVDVANSEAGDEEDEDDSATDNPFAPLRNNRPLVRNNGHGAADDYHWESGFKSEIPEFHGTANAEELLDWIVTVEEILEFKRVPLERCVLVIAMQFRNRAAAWWTQLKTSRIRLGKPKIMAWDKLKTKLRNTFLPYNYDQIMFQRLHHIRQGTRSVSDYSTEFFLLLTRVDIQDSERQLVARFTAGLRQQIQHTLNLFHPLTLSEAHQQAITIEAQTKTSFPAWTNNRTSRTPPTQPSPTPTDDSTPSKTDTAVVPFSDNRNTRPSSLQCFSCGEIGHRQSNCPTRNRRGQLLDTAGNDVKVVYDEDTTEHMDDSEILIADSGPALMV
ncbi:hypothetical protein N665_0791s0013 [Sinapis alba]|nr:hypothetical protein N665_0791s0013 [Sinapis alba]